MKEIKIKRNGVTKTLTLTKIGKKSTYLVGMKAPIPVVSEQSLQQDIKWVGEKLTVRLLNKALRAMFIELYSDNLDSNGKLVLETFKMDAENLSEGVVTLAQLQQELEKAIDNNNIAAAKSCKVMINIIHKKYSERAAKRKQTMSNFQ